MILNYQHVKTHYPYRQVFVMGMYHTGTCALIRELTNRYRIPIYPKLIKEFHDNRVWKHAFEKSPYYNNQNVLVVVLVKDPFFWFQSLKRNKKDLQVKTLDGLAGTIIFNGRSYKNAVDLWNTYITNYLDTSRFSPNNTLILSYETFLFRYQETMDIFDTLLPLIPGSGNHLAINIKSHPHSTCRNRLEALEHYRFKNRYLTLSENEITTIQKTVDKRLLDSLDYRHDTFPIIKLPLTIDNLNSMVNQELINPDELISKALSSSKTSSSSQKEKNVNVIGIQNDDSDISSNISDTNAVSDIDLINPVSIKDENPEMLEEVTIEAKTGKLVNNVEVTTQSNSNLNRNYRQNQKINPVLLEHALMSNNNSLAGMYKSLKRFKK